MNIKRITETWGPEEWALVGYLWGIAVWWLCERLLSASTSASTTNNTEHVGGYDHVQLGEQALTRIEDGETVAVQRWHGGTVKLSGDLVVDVPTETDSAEDERE